MKSFIVFALVLAVTVAAPAGPDSLAQTRSYVDNPNTGDGQTESKFETDNGISIGQQTQLTNPGTENEGIAMRGRYSYTGTDGIVYTVEWVADQNGYQPSAAHLPTAPQ